MRTAMGKPASGNLQYSIGSSAGCSVVTEMGGMGQGRRSERERYRYTYS